MFGVELLATLRIRNLGKKIITFSIGKSWLRNCMPFFGTLLDD